MTAELKKGKYIYYHCTGKRGGNCKSDLVREEKLDEVFEDLINRIPNPDSGIFEEIKRAVKDMHTLKGEYTETSTEAIERQIKTLQTRIDNLYIDKLDGRIEHAYWQEKHNEWYMEKEDLIRKLESLNNASRNFDEGSNLLADFCKFARDTYHGASPKKKRAILKMLGSNFTYKDKKLSVELSSVFNYLLKLPVGNYGGANLPKLEPNLRLYINIYNAINQEFVDNLKTFFKAA